MSDANSPMSSKEDNPTLDPEEPQSEKESTDGVDNGKLNLAKKQIGPPDLDYWDDLVGQRINDAVSKGVFDKLSGKGKPLKLRGNPMAGDYQLAYDLMEDNDLTPQWIMDRKRVQTEIGEFRAEIAAQSAHHAARLADLSTAEELDHARIEWDRQVAEWERKLETLNDRIQMVNFIQPPVPTLEIIKLRLADELKRAGAP